MIQAKCIQKFRDKQNKIYGYRLVDLNGQTQDVTPENLKRAIANKQINVVNLTLTSDYRLVDTNEKQLQSKKLGGAPKDYISREDKFFEAVENIETAFCKYVGDESCTADINKDYDGESYIHQILGVYYPEEYKGNPNDADQCYGVTLLIDTKEVWVAWQGDNGMAKEEFSESANLVSPLYSSKNIEIIRNTFERFGKRVKNWIDNDRNGTK